MEGTPDPPQRRTSKFKRRFRRFRDIILCRGRPSDPPAPSEASSTTATSANPPQLSLTLPLSTTITLSPTPSPILRKVEHQIQAQERRIQNAGLPVNNLPPELLAEVFAIVCFSPIDATNTARRTRTTPLTLAKICSHWRHVILSTPHLWSWVLIRLYESKYPKQLDLIKDWIGRTAPNQPLTIELSFEDEDVWKDKPPHELIKYLLSQSHRWHSIDLTLPEACYNEIKAFNAEYPILTNIALQPLLSDAHVSQAERKRLDVFENVPQLSQLRLNGYYLDDCLVPWSQLQELVLQHVYIDECFFALNQTINLVSCTLSTMLLNDCNRPVAKRYLPLPRLESLRMQGASGKDQGMLVQHLVVPSLSEFVLSSLDASVAFEDIPGMVTRSGCLLRVFELNGLDLSEAPLVDLLRDLPTIETLRIAPNSSDMSNLFLETAEGDVSPVSPAPTTAHVGPFLPNLQHLEYDGDASFDEETLMRMIRLRCEREQGGGGITGSAAFLRNMDVLKISVQNKSYSAECMGVLERLGQVG
ncbi:hypothetical protein DFP72DRAFT_816240 [Ephemerocybe angulata]|uniref:F-box domain-containing protein n=1 Tax=Ephemerocybe angulata TaxID=980116 RepID=A0A8H6M253_9AGAR|nr:hypothetical protein DFP72DRAFT_816240 [Tulosesus angulatus]